MWYDLLFNATYDIIFMAFMLINRIYIHKLQEVRGLASV